MNANTFKLLLVLSSFVANAISYLENKSIQKLEIARFKIDYLSVDDIPRVANLISEGFSGPFQWWQKMEKFYALKTAEMQLESRYQSLVCTGTEHAMIVVRDEEAKVLVGFIEIGMMQSPSIANVESSIGKLPFIGNLVVDTSFRRRGLGKMLMLRAFEEASVWKQFEVRCAVEVGNDAAKQLYVDRLGFEVLGIEKAKFLDSTGDKIHLKKILEAVDVVLADDISREAVSL